MMSENAEGRSEKGIKSPLLPVPTASGRGDLGVCKNLGTVPSNGTHPSLVLIGFAVITHFSPLKRGLY